MSVNQSNNNLSYGLNNALQSANPEYIFAKRAPGVTDSAAFGTFWFYRVSAKVVNIYIFTSSGVWDQLPLGTSSPVFTGLTVNGNSLFDMGTFTVSSGTNAIAISGDAAATTVGIATGAGVKALTLGSTNSTSSVTINSGTGASLNIGTSIAKTITIGNATGATALVFNAGTGLSSFNSGVATAPVNSSVATAAFVASLTAGTSVQNTTGYDLLCNITLIVSSSTTATITLGVGVATGPTTNTVVPSFTTASSIIVPIVAWVPNNYFLVYNTTGTIVVASATVQSCPL